MEKGRIPQNAVVLLVGVAGCGKSTLAKKAFRDDSTIIVSSDECRKEISGNENDQSVTPQAFELFYKKIREGLEEGKRVIADATNLNKMSREKIYEIAKVKNVPVYALLFNIPLELIKKQNELRERKVPEYAIDRMFEQMERSYKEICNEISKENLIDIIPDKGQNNIILEK